MISKINYIFPLYIKFVCSKIIFNFLYVLEYSLVDL